MELGGINRPNEEKVFLISTTHGGETHALSAALATISVFRTKPVVKHNHSIGDELISGCNKVLAESGLTDYIYITPCNWLLTFSFMNKEKQVCQGYRTLMMQEMIKRGILFQGAFVPCFSHTHEDIDYFITAFNESCMVYKQALQSGYTDFLIGEPSKPVFRKFL
jgi:glutamate-1-semialdehyde aminotransferase